MCTKCDSTLEFEEVENNDTTVDRVTRCGQGHIQSVETIRRLDVRYKNY